MSMPTAKEYALRLNSFRKFMLAHYNGRITVDSLIDRIKEGSENPYSIINNYAAYLLNSNNISNLTLKQRVITAKNFLEYHDVDISPRKLKMKVKLPKAIIKKKEALSKEFREGDMARPVGEEKYAIVDHNSHTELAFVLELPKELGEAQKELGIEKEASYVITVINPKIPKREEYLPSTEEAPKYPESILTDFDDNENFVPLSRNLKFIDYQNAQIILIGAREGKDTLRQAQVIICLKSAKNKPNNPYSLDKQNSSYHDTLDALRLSLCSLRGLT
jgi:hypothetical protein